MTHQIITMPYTVCGQPRYAIFSTGVNRWIASDMSAFQVTEYYATRAAEKARRDIKEQLDDIRRDPAEVYADFALTFEEANKDSVDAGGQDLVHCCRVIGTAPRQDPILGEIQVDVLCQQPRRHHQWIPCSGSIVIEE